MSSSKFDFISIGKSIDGTSYCSGAETYAENIIENNENDSVIVFPCNNKWAKLRASSYKMTTENAGASLPLPIYKIKKFLLKPFTVHITASIITDGMVTGTKKIPVTLQDFKNSKGDFFELDISKVIVTEQERKALPLSEKNREFGDIKCKDNTFEYKEGSDFIAFDSTVYTHYVLGVETEYPVYHKLLVWLENRIGDIAKESAANGDPYKYVHDEPGVSAPVVYLGSYLNGFIFGEIGEGAYDIRDFQYRVEYVPITPKTKIRARKTAKQDIEYLQPFNQRAEINAASAFGKNMWLTAQKTGTEQITVVKNYTKLNDIPPVGASVKHNGKKYRLVSNSYNQTNTVYIQVTHTLSENWTSKSKHVSVNQKYRNYNIPQDILWRNMYWEDYITVSSTGKTVAEDKTTGKILDKAIQLFYVPSTNDSTMDTFSWMFNGRVVGQIQDIGTSILCSTMGLANSMVISASFKDNLSAGLRENYTGDDDYICEDAWYCNEDGTLETATVILSDGYGNGTYENGVLTENYNEENQVRSEMVYPSIVKITTNNFVYNAPKNPIFEKKFYVDKDASEAIKFTYQVHFVTEGDCVVGNKVAEHNPLIKRYEKSNTARQFKVWLLKDHIREGEDLIVPTDNDLAVSHTANGEVFTVWHPTGGNNARIALKDEVKAKLKNYKAWAITDENNHLYVGRNENQEGIVHLCISHKRN